MDKIIAKMQQAGFELAVINERLAVSPYSKLTNNQKHYLSEHKTEIISFLSLTKTCQSNELLQAIREQVEERAAIMEFDGGLSRREAEKAALSRIRIYSYRVKDKPDSDLTVIMPDTDLKEARQILALKYGDRLILVAEKSIDTTLISSERIPA